MFDIYPGSDWTRLESGLLAPPSSEAARNAASPIPAVLYYHEDALNSAFITMVTRQNLRYMARESFQTRTTEIDWKMLATLGADIVWAEDYQTSHGAIVTLRNALVSIQLTRSGGGWNVWLTAAANDFARAKTVIEILNVLFHKIEKSKDPAAITVKFWMNGPRGPQQTARTIAAPSFTEIADNYAPEARKVLDHMISNNFEPGAGGQLILWHGPPGTGKTFGLRALAREWAPWCDTEYVIDPEQFFGDANYLMSALLSSQPEYEWDEDEGIRKPKDKWRLLIFEDTGELLAADARARTGQGLSRLLNVVDGFVGQGLRTIILITTNEDFEKLHPAVTRPGRCAAKANFGPLSKEQSREWAERHNVTVPNAEHTLAELFAIRDGAFNDEDVPISRPIGFNSEFVQ